MSDKELLELAAKAAGYQIDARASFMTLRDLGKFAIHNPMGGHSMWNPLTDDGDALRLVVKLGEKFPCFTCGIFNRASFPYASASIVHRNGEETYVEQDDNEDMAETLRLAIVCVAAEIGKEMK